MNNIDDINNSVMISNMISFDHIINKKISIVFRKYGNNMYGFLNYDEDYLSLNEFDMNNYLSEKEVDDYWDTLVKKDTYIEK